MLALQGEVDFAFSHRAFSKKRRKGRFCRTGLGRSKSGLWASGEKGENVKPQNKLDERSELTLKHLSGADFCLARNLSLQRKMAILDAEKKAPFSTFFMNNF